jgi:hypothetical protein
MRKHGSTSVWGSWFLGQQGSKAELHLELRARTSNSVDFEVISTRAFEALRSIGYSPLKNFPCGVLWYCGIVRGSATTGGVAVGPLFSAFTKLESALKNAQLITGIASCIQNLFSC